MKIHVIEITEYRPPEVLQVEEREIPTPAGPMGGLTRKSTVYGLNGLRLKMIKARLSMSGSRIRNLAG